MFLYTDTRMLDHRPHPTHPEAPERLATVLRHLTRTKLIDRFERPQVRPATDEELLRVHSIAHLERIRSESARGSVQVEGDTWVSPGSDSAGRLASGAVVDALQAVASGATDRAFCLARPPGHHARRDQPMGFCLFGSVAVGVASILATHEVDRVLIVDWDVHHGNGTQEMFYDREDVGFFSIHRHPFYPGSGGRDETGTGRGLGRTRNVPVPAGISRADYLLQFRENLEGFADRIRPEIIVISAGFDAHVEDPIGGLGLVEEDFVTMLRTIKEIAAVHAEHRIVSVLEGGYNRPILAGCVSEHLLELNQQ